MDYIQNVNPTPLQSPGGRSAKSMIIIVVLLLALLGVAGYAYWWLASGNGVKETETQTPVVTGGNTTNTVSEDDTTQTIDAELKATSDMGDINTEFKSIDQDTSTL